MTTFPGVPSSSGQYTTTVINQLKMGSYNPSLTQNTIVTNNTDDYYYQYLKEPQSSKEQIQNITAVLEDEFKKQQSFLTKNDFDENEDL